MRFVMRNSTRVPQDGLTATLDIWRLKNSESPNQIPTKIVTAGVGRPITNIAAVAGMPGAYDMLLAASDVDRNAAGCTVFRIQDTSAAAEDLFLYVPFEPREGVW